MCGRFPNRRRLRSTLVAAGVSGGMSSCLWGLPVPPLTPLLRILALRRPLPSRLLLAKDRWFSTTGACPRKHWPSPVCSEPRRVIRKNMSVTKTSVLVLDCAEPEALAGFYAVLLDAEIRVVSDPDFVELVGNKACTWQSAGPRLRRSRAGCGRMTPGRGIDTRRTRCPRNEPTGRGEEGP